MTQMNTTPYAPVPPLSLVRDWEIINGTSDNLIDALHKAVTDANTTIVGQPYSPRQQQEKMLRALIRTTADRAEYMDPPEPPLTSPCSEYDSGFGHGALAMKQQFVAWLRADAAEAEGESWVGP
jgi:hypothetical protein